MGIEVKVVDAEGSSDKTASTLDLLGDLDIPDRAARQIKQDVGDFLIEQIRLSAHDAKSPVEGGEWRKELSPAYLAKKKREGGRGEADLELTGDLMDSIEFKMTDSGIEIGVFGDQAGKADGHNNLSGDSPLPERRFLPDVGQEFVGRIQKEIEKIVADGIAENVSLKKEDLSGIQSKSALYALLEELFDGLDRSEIKGAVLRNSELVDMLDGEGLLELL